MGVEVAVVVHVDQDHRQRPPQDQSIVVAENEIVRLFFKSFDS